jgi:hypothetical protein
MKLFLTLNVAGAKKPAPAGKTAPRLVGNQDKHF